MREMEAEKFTARERVISEELKAIRNQLSWLVYLPLGAVVMGYCQWPYLSP